MAAAVALHVYEGEHREARWRAAVIIEAPQ
jgi:hypothetical protein